MNIFMIFLAFIFVAGYYYLDAPAYKDSDNPEEVFHRTEMQSAVSCLVGLHNVELDAIKEGKPAESNSPCGAKYKISTVSVCMDDEGNIASSCPTGRAAISSPNARFVVTKSDWTDAGMAAKIMKIIQDKHKNLSSIGMVMSAEDSDGLQHTAILSETRQPIWLPSEIVSMAELQSGNLAYMTQYTGDELESIKIKQAAKELVCAPGEVKVFRFRAWRCEEPVAVQLCPGDTIYDRELGECVVNSAMQPLCGPGETAVMIDSVWECNAPVQETKCPAGQMASFDFDALKWVCISDPLTNTREKECKKSSESSLNCGDCETEVVDPDTCEVSCVPDEARLAFKGCYPDVSECAGALGSKSFYFGFPEDASYVENARKMVAGLASVNFGFDTLHSKNRKFNCLDCAPFKIDLDSVFYPFVANCEYSGTLSSVCGANSVFVAGGTGGGMGKCMPLDPALVPPCPAGYGRKTLSAACSPNWCNDAKTNGVYCDSAKPLMMLSKNGCAYCIAPEPGQIPVLRSVEIDIRKNAGNNGWTGGVVYEWSTEMGDAIPVIPSSTPGFDYLGGRKISEENIFEDGRVVNPIDALKWGDKIGMPVPLPVPVPE